MRIVDSAGRPYPYLVKTFWEMRFHPELLAYTSRGRFAAKMNVTRRTLSVYLASVNTYSNTYQGVRTSMGNGVYLALSSFCPECYPSRTWKPTVKEDAFFKYHVCGCCGLVLPNPSAVTFIENGVGQLEERQSTTDSNRGDPTIATGRDKRFGGKPLSTSDLEDILKSLDHSKKHISARASGLQRWIYRNNLDHDFTWFVMSNLTTSLHKMNERRIQRGRRPVSKAQIERILNDFRRFTKSRVEAFGMVLERDAESFKRRAWRKRAAA